MEFIQNNVITGDLNINTLFSYKSDNISIIDYILKYIKNDYLSVLFEIKESIENNILNLINDNELFNNYIQYILKEWNLNISPDNLFKSNIDFILSQYNIYGNFVDFNNDYNNNNINYKNINIFINNLHSILKNLEPLYNYIIIDLSMKNKKEYLRLNNKNKKNILQIPNNINIIYLNYIYIINMIKKELHFILITTLSFIDNSN